MGMGGLEVRLGVDFKVGCAQCCAMTAAGGSHVFAGVSHLGRALSYLRCVCRPGRVWLLVRQLVVNF